MENEELPFRATKDVDVVLSVEFIIAEFAGYHLSRKRGWI